MGRRLDKMLQAMSEGPPAPGRRGEARWKREEARPEGLSRPPRRPRGAVTVNPLPDPLAGVKRSLDSTNRPASRHPQVEFEPIDVKEIRHKLHATQRQFARMFGISVETLRNWEQGKRRPHGPSRALLRVAKANPEDVARTLWRYRRAWWMD